MPKGINNRTGRGSQYKHGLASKPWSQEYRCWVQMRNRCNNPNKPDYPYYGGRGIRVCPRWDSYEDFLADMGYPPTPQHTIERRNSNGDYEPDNCYWATRQQQAVNRDYCKVKPAMRGTIKKLYASGNFTQQQLADQYGVTQVQISSILRMP